MYEPTFERTPGGVELLGEGDSVTLLANSLVNTTVDMTVTEHNQYIICSVPAEADTIVITLPAVTNYRGKEYIIKKNDANDTGVAITSVSTIDDEDTKYIKSQYQYIRIVGGVAIWLIIGE